MTKQTLKLLGPVQVEWQEGKPPRFRSQRTTALLGYLAAEKRPIARRTLAALLWPDESAVSGQTNLRRELHNLNQILPGCWQMDPSLVKFVPDSETIVDIATLSRLDQEEQWPDASVWISGEFLEGLQLDDNPEFEAWLLGERERWRQLAERSLMQTALFQKQQGNYPEARRTLARLLQFVPWHEEGHRQMMRLLAQSGQFSAALKQYELCRAVLAAELDILPSSATTRLYEGIKMAQVLPPPNLPMPVTPFIGRETEGAALRRYLTDPDCRLLTLTGVGGIGKSRLALQAARQMTGDNYRQFLHGVTFIPLVGVDSQDLITAVGSGLGLAFAGSEPVERQLLHYLKGKEMLLLLDNYEHLLPETALLAAILREAPAVKLLITSRERLRLQEEWLFNLSGLDYPARSSSETIEHYSAVQLFVQRARQVERSFLLSAADMLPVAHICRLCQGMPLAIELAAAAVRYQSCAQIAGQLQINWQSLTTTYTDVPKRHQSVHAAFEHSWALLSTAEKQVFCGLSQLRGGFDAEAAAHVTLATMEMLHTLLDKSLVQRIGSGRFGMHPLVQQYAAEKLRQLGLHEETGGRHLAYFLSLAEQGEAQLKGAEQLLWLTKLEMEQQNVLAAVAWGIAADLEGAARLAAANWLFWFMHSHLREGQRQYATLLERKADLPTHLRGRVLTGYAAMSFFQGDTETAAAASEEGLQLFQALGDTEGMALSLHHLALVANMRGESDRAAVLYKEILTLTRTLSDNWLTGVTIHNQGEYYRARAQYEQARAAYTEALILGQGRGDKFSILFSENSLAHLAVEQGNFTEAKQQYEKTLFLAAELGAKQLLIDTYSALGEIALQEGNLSQATASVELMLATSQEIGEVLRAAYAFTILGDIAVRRGCFDQAAAAYREEVRSYRQGTYTRGVVACLEKLAEVAWLREQAPRAVSWLATAETLRNRLQLPRTSMEQERYERCLQTIRAQVDENSYARLWTAGTVTTVDAAVDEALSET